MTCIAAYVDDRGVGHMASDSLGTSRVGVNQYKNWKMFVKGDMLIGYTSSYRMGQLLEYSLDLPKRDVSAQSIQQYMCTDFIEEVRGLLKSHGFTRINANEEEIGTFLVVVDGSIFKVGSDLSVLEFQDPFGACGSGANHAIAAMAAMHAHTKLEPRQIVKESVGIASKYVSTVGGDVRYMSSRAG